MMSSSNNANNIINTHPTAPSIMMLSSSNANNIINNTQQHYSITTCRLLSSSATNYTEDSIISPPTTTKEDGGARGQRVWKAQQNNSDKNEQHQGGQNQNVHNNAQVYYWNRAVDDVKDRRVVDESLSRICEQVCMYVLSSLVFNIIGLCVYDIESFSNVLNLCNLSYLNDGETKTKTAGT